MLFAWHTAKVQTIDDVFTHELIVAAPAPRRGSTGRRSTRSPARNSSWSPATKGPPRAKIAMMRGEVEALSLPWSVLRAENPEWLRDKKINLLLQTG